METKVAIAGIIAENSDAAARLNGILHNHAEHIIGRMGIPYPKKQVSIISIAVDAPQSIISALTGKIGKLKGISSKTAYQGKQA